VTKQPPEDTTEDNYCDLHDRRADQEQQERCSDGDDCSLQIGAQRSRHSPDCLSDNRDSHELQAVQESNTDGTVERRRSVCE
jgi:hypothetical protein